MRCSRNCAPRDDSTSQEDSMPTARQWIQLLGLEPHVEGGYFRRTFQADHRARVRTPGASATPSRRSTTC
nr:cupin domain-containing protein [Kitasatospora paracochleata]